VSPINYPQGEAEPRLERRALLKLAGKAELFRTSGGKATSLRSHCWIIGLQDRSAQTRRREQQADDCLRVFDLSGSNHLQRAINRQTNNFYHLVVFETALSFSQFR